jgi:hypothetical protein
MRQGCTPARVYVHIQLLLSYHKGEHMGISHSSSCCSCKQIGMSS